MVPVAAMLLAHPDGDSVDERTFFLLVQAQARAAQHHTNSSTKNLCLSLQVVPPVPWSLRLEDRVQKLFKAQPRKIIR